MEESKEESKERSGRGVKCIIYLAILFTVAVFGVMAWFIPSATVITAPKFTLATITPSNIAITNETSFEMDLRAEFAVKNKNLGFFSYRATEATFLYRGTPVGEATIGKSSVGARSTKRFNVTVPMSSNRVLDRTELGLDLSRGVLPVTCEARLKGRVETMKVSRSRTVRLSCVMLVDLKARVVRDLKCV